MTIAELQRTAKMLRLDTMESIFASGDGHAAPSMSIAEILTVLYFEVMNIRPTEPRWQQRDRFVLSKGHACPILYAALARKGYFSLDELTRLRMAEGLLQGHPEMKTPGIDSVSGSLGNGLAVATGIALGCKIQKQDNYTYAIIGDGEMQEGLVWEAAINAASHQLGRLIVFSDCNNYQSGGHVTDMTSLYPVSDKWQAFHWHVQHVNGHDIPALLAAVQAAKNVPDRPSLIECQTVKGKGISFMENNNAWHKRVPTQDEMDIIRRELEVTA